MTKKIIVACGGAIATSTLAADKIQQLADKNGIDITICQCRISEIASNLDGAALIVPTTRLKKDFGIPLIPGTSFITGLGRAQTEEDILRVLKS